jgi:hypothetical protein
MRSKSVGGFILRSHKILRLHLFTASSFYSGWVPMLFNTGCERFYDKRGMIPDL